MQTQKKFVPKITFQDDLTENKWNMTQTIFTLPKDGVRKKVRNSRRAGELGVLPQQERPLYHHTRAKWYSWKHVYVSMQKLVVATPQSAPPLMLDSLFGKKSW